MKMIYDGIVSCSKCNCTAYITTDYNSERSKLGLYIINANDANTRQQHNCQPSWLVDPFLQQIFDLVIRDEGLVARVSNSNCIPVVDDVRPRLEESREDVKFKPRYMVILGDVDRLFESLSFGGSGDLVNLAKPLDELAPNHNDP